MSLDGPLVFAGLCVFVRCAALMLTAPIFGTVVPVNVRVLLSAVIAFALAPAVQPHVGPLPQETVSLILAVGREVLAGVVIGGAVQLVVSMCQSAGAFLDIQVGTAASQVFNPLFGGAATPIAQFKLMLGIVIVFLADGHLAVLRAFALSFSAVGPSPGHTPGELLVLIGQLGVLGMQIAAPVVATTVILDVSAGLINRAVPQTQPFMLSLPIKLTLGVGTLAIGLPALVTAVHLGLDRAIEAIGLALR